MVLESAAGFLVFTGSLHPLHLFSAFSVDYGDFAPYISQWELYFEFIASAFPQAEQRLH